MTLSYEPKRYWDDRLQKDFTLSGVGQWSYSEGYNRWTYRAKERALSRLLERGERSVAGKSILDVGSGIGYWLTWYQRRGAARISAIELSPTAVRRLRMAFPHVEVVEGDIAGGTPRIDPVDIVNVQSVLFHIVEPSAFDRALDNLARLVRRGAHIGAE